MQPIYTDKETLRKILRRVRDTREIPLGVRTWEAVLELDGYIYEVGQGPERGWHLTELGRATL